MSSSRRQFLSSVSGAFALVGAAPNIPSLMVQAAEQQAGSRRDGKVLVVVQLSGGNDGINTVIPYDHDEYHANRFTLAFGKDSVLKIDEGLGLHPSMDGMAELLEGGKLAIVNGVGYPNPNRSHFESMDLWHTAHRTKSTVPMGWLGQWIQESALDLGGLHLGENELPVALRAEDAQVPSVRSFDEFRLRVRGGGDRRELISELVAQSAPQGETDLLSFVRGSSETALKASDRMEEVSNQASAQVGFPGTSLGRKLSSVAQMIRADLPTRVYYVTLDGFDTHANQREAHAGLLSQVSDAVAAFTNEMAAIGESDRVLTFVFSEFGRRLKENASQGTDHGAAAPVFLAGGGVNSGLIGDYPSLSKLDDGDLIFNTDYRQVYAALIEDWLGGDAAAILGEQFKKSQCLKT